MRITLRSTKELAISCCCCCCCCCCCFCCCFYLTNESREKNEQIVCLYLSLIVKMPQFFFVSLHKKGFSFSLNEKYWTVKSRIFFPASKFFLSSLVAVFIFLLKDQKISREEKQEIKPERNGMNLSEYEIKREKTFLSQQLGQFMPFSSTLTWYYIHRVLLLNERWEWNYTFRLSQAWRKATD